MKNICTNCFPINQFYSSKYEEDVENFLIKNSISFLKNDRKTLSGMELDFLLTDYNLAIEINGEYWHSDLFKSKNYHLDKTNSCMEKGIQLIHLWESDFCNKREIIESLLLNKINLSKKIYARKCVVKKLNFIETKNFLNENHLQGWCISKFSYGLFFENELMSLMTFGKLRKNLGNNNISLDKFELLRFCNKKNVTVTGGANKLLKYFENEVNPTEIISYANRDISNGKLYENLGFEFQKATDVGYWWFNTKRYNRFSFRKSELIKTYPNMKHMTEDEIMKSLGYVKVYNSGNLKYIKRFK